MSLWAIVPIKPLRRGKSRLAGILSEDERTLLNTSMLGNTLKTLGEVSEISTILVVSRDPSALALAREHGARTVQEDGSPELNTALRRATIAAQMYAADGVLILPADLPLVTPEDLRKFIFHAGKPPEIVIAPDRRMDGTNALLVNPPGLIEYSFGPGSFNRHVEQARKFNIRVEICDLPTLGLDLDLPEDLEYLKQLEQTEMNKP